jgi:hypothetical protein
MLNDGWTDMEKLMGAFLQLFVASEREMDLREVDCVSCWIQLESPELFFVCFVCLMSCLSSTKVISRAVP